LAHSSIHGKRAGLRSIGGELADQTALARAGLSVEQHHPAALALRARQQHTQLLQLLQLVRPADERKRRGNAKSSRKLSA
jgi:hypothetical protein